MTAQPITDDPVLPEHLAPTEFVDSDSPQVRAYVARVVGDEPDPVRRAVLLFEAVRDGIWYDPHHIASAREAYRASAVAEAPSNWCVPKAVLLTAAARAAGIPARLGFADVRNHLTSSRLQEKMGGADLFVFHGYTDLYLNGRWVKATPAFNAELCARFGVAPIPFHGDADALMHEFTGDGSRHMEYVRYRGVYTDLPLDEILVEFAQVYGSAMVGHEAGPAEVDEFVR
ncbi:MAG TPA: transglutaminase family protein [Pseudonocardia sp.]|jgi:transglutaminase-like putative cysteine protease|nr:transglutaminase family protein [Pseudonocardia sp.]